MLRNIKEGKEKDTEEKEKTWKKQTPNNNVNDNRINYKYTYTQHRTIYKLNKQDDCIGVFLSGLLHSV